MFSFHLPPEWHPQSGVMLTWPHPHGPWEPYLAEADHTFTAIAREISRREKLLITTYNPTHQNHIQNLLEKAGVDLRQVAFFEAPSDDVWVRDHGPLTVLAEGRPLLLDFRFNAWGQHYPEYEQDNQITRKLFDQGAFGKTPVLSLPFVLEGGGIEVDGQGTLLTTESVMLDPLRNVCDGDSLTQQFEAWFGIKRVLWLKHGHLAGDDTGGHIDTLVRFANPHTLCYVRCEDPQEEHYESLAQLQEELFQLTDYQGNPYKLIPLPLPKPQFDETGKRLPATYANFLIINGAVLLPTYDDPPLDAQAQRQLQLAFPTQEIIPIPCRSLIHLYGSLHCATMQLPEGIL